MYTQEEKDRYVRLRKAGYTAKQVYEIAKKEQDITCKEQTFERSMRKWACKSTLEQGTYEGFVPYGATVQVDGQGNIRQAWIKQDNAEEIKAALIEEIKKNTPPVHIEPKTFREDHLLEIPIFDAHFPMSDYSEELERIVHIIQEGWEKVVVVIGQDLFHNDCLMHGRTSKGTEIEKIDVVDAWHKASVFLNTIIENSLLYSSNVSIVYSMGNHDETIGWCFVQMLKERYPQVPVDDTIRQRKCVLWNGCFIGFTHGHTSKNKPNDMRGQFTSEFPYEFAASNAREIHCGHLHHEEANDVYGIVVRRLPSAVPTDEWNSKEGYVGAHKRFMLFDWKSNALASIRFV